MAMRVVPYRPDTWNSGEVPKVTAWSGGLGAEPSSAGGLVRISVNTRTAPFIMVDCTKPISPRWVATAPLGRPVCRW